MPASLFDVAKTTNIRRPGVVGVNLLRLRKLAGLSQEELGNRSGVHRVTIASLETGQHSEPDFETIQKLATALGVKTSDLTEGSADVALADPMLEDFKASPWGQITKPTAEEERWLRSLPGVVWLNVKPSPETLHHMLLAYRAGTGK